jgi:hypothetical protein
MFFTLTYDAIYKLSLHFKKVSRILNLVRKEFNIHTLVLTLLYVHLVLLPTGLAKRCGGFLNSLTVRVKLKLLIYTELSEYPKAAIPA